LAISAKLQTHQRDRSQPRMQTVHHSAADGYKAKAGTYAKGRPHYPSEIEGWLRHDIGLSDGKTVLDLGAGTGKFIPKLLATEQP
jgi:hypothetical protein